MVDSKLINIKQQQAIKNEISGSFDLKVESLKVCNPNCEYFEPTTDKTIAKYQVKNRVTSSTTHCSNLHLCRNALKRYLNSKQISDIQKLLDGDEK